MKEAKPIVTYNGYFYLLNRDHPKATEKRPYVAEHTLVMEEHIGRYLSDDECVHHIDFNKKNNLLENLKLMTKKEHSKYHGSLKVKKMVEVKCSCCGNIFEIELRRHKTRTKLGYQNCYCNRICMGRSQGRVNGKKNKRLT